MSTDQATNNDEGTDRSGDDKRLHAGERTTADIVDKDDPHKAEKLTKAGRDIDPDAGSD